MIKIVKFFSLNQIFNKNSQNFNDFSSQSSKLKLIPKYPLKNLRLTNPKMVGNTAFSQHKLFLVLRCSTITFALICTHIFVTHIVVKQQQQQHTRMKEHEMKFH